MGTESARRVGDLLIELGAASEAIGVNELARRVGISPTVAHRILQALLSRDLAVQEGDTQKYGLGMAALQLGGSAFLRMDFQRFAHPILEELVEATQLTATLSLLTGTRRMYVDQALPPTELRFSVEIGVPYGLTRGSTGRALLAALPQATVDRVISADEDLADTESRQLLHARLDEVRRDGYAIAHGERIEGAGGVARAFGRSDRPLFGAVNVMGPRHLFTPDRIGSYIKAVARAAAAIDDLLSTGNSIPSR
jgi:DNA-binding IclR family transcriptional regulator